MVELKHMLTFVDLFCGGGFGARGAVFVQAQVWSEGTEARNQGAIAALYSPARETIGTAHGIRPRAASHRRR